MPTSLYNFQYVPLTGKLPGKSFVSQTEQAINGLAQYVYNNSTNYEAVKAIAQKAEEDSSSALEYSEEALDKAQTALETVGRAYIKTTSAVDLNDYFASELLVILSTSSTNLPASISGYLTVMSSDTHDYCMQVYIGIDGSVYKRTATISNNTPTFGAWSETPITMSSLQTVLNNYTTVNASNIGVNAQADNSVAWGNAIGGGEIANGEQRLITGGTVYPLSQNVAQNTSNIATNTEDIVQNTGGVSANSKRISNIEKLLQGNLYDYQTDSTSAYTKSVPSGAMPYAGIEQIGGKTVVMNQLMYDPTMTNASNWGNMVNPAQFSSSVSDNVLTYTRVSGTTNIQLYCNTNPVSPIVGHIYYISCDISASLTVTGAHFYVGSIGSGFDISTTLTKNSDIISCSALTVGTAMLNFVGIKLPVNDYLTVKNFVCVDLTLAFGSGNEPSTVAEFESMFPASYYPYNEGELLSAGVTEVKSYENLNNQAVKRDTSTTVKTEQMPIIQSNTYIVSVAGSSIDVLVYRVYYYKQDGSYLSYNSVNQKNVTVTAPSNAFFMLVQIKKVDGTEIFVSEYTLINAKVLSLINTYSIPASIQALEGYGWSAGTAYNYIDFERKVFVQNVGRVDLGSLSWNYSQSYTNAFFYTNVLDRKKGINSNLVVAKYANYIPSLGAYFGNNAPDDSMAFTSTANSTQILVRDDTYTDATTFKTAMNGVYLYYELETPVETDVSEYLTDDNLINVESGGTLTFPNSNGTDYQIPVPSDVTYMIDLQSALGE